VHELRWVSLDRLALILQEVYTLKTKVAIEKDVHTLLLAKEIPRMD
jgi:hypothetical protein